MAEWCAHCTRLKFGQTVSHDSYLINLASPDDAAVEEEHRAVRRGAARCVVLKIPYLVTHPGAHMGEGEEDGTEAGGGGARCRASAGAGGEPKARRRRW